MALIIDNLSAPEALMSIYVGLFARPADPEGLAFWQGAFSTLPLTNIVTAFLDQPEATIAEAYIAAPSEETAESFITGLYGNLFGRAPEAEGLAFWRDVLLAEPGLEVTEVVLAVMEGAQDSGPGLNDLTTLSHRIEVGVFFTDAVETAGIPDFPTDLGREVIAEVDDTRASVEEAKQVFDSIREDSTSDVMAVPTDIGPILIEDVGLIGVTDNADGF